MDAASDDKIKHPIAIEWKIPEKTFRGFNDPNKIFFSSDDDIISDVEYYVGMFFENGDAYVTFHLNNSKNKKIEKAYIEMKIESVNYCEAFDAGNGDTDRIICKIDELLDPETNYIVDGELSIKIDGFLMIPKEKESDEIWECKNYGDSLGLRLWKQENKDFVIIVDGKEITAHKCVLSTLSPVFSRMFETNMKESKENKVDIEDFPFKIVEAAIKFSYHQSLVPTLNLEDKMKLLQFFDKYDIQQLKDDLETYLITVINEFTVCRLTNASLLSNALKLKIKCSEFLRDCLKTKPIADFDILDKDFALSFLKNSFCIAMEGADVCVM